MIAGIGGASLGTELQKALVLAGRYDIYGCDVSPTAYGLYEAGFEKTFLIDRDNYVSEVASVCRHVGADFLIPGGEQPMTLLSMAQHELPAGTVFVCNCKEVIAVCADKAATFSLLAEAGVAIPKTCIVRDAESIRSVGTPCIVKPSTGSGGSVMVFFAVDVEEALLYAEHIRRNVGIPIAQEYITDTEGEFTVGVLSLPTGQIAGSIALKRSLDAKLSTAYRGQGGVISSGYSQGYIGDYPEIREQSERIATTVRSYGPLNVQGRVRHGLFIPFEINPRFSASTYLRALAGFNEVDMLLQHLITGTPPPPAVIRSGWYLRSLSERFVAVQTKI